MGNFIYVMSCCWKPSHPVASVSIMATVRMFEIGAKLRHFCYANVTSSQNDVKV